MSTTTTLVKEKTRLTVPMAVQRKAGISPGDRVEFKAVKGAIMIVTKSPVVAEDEYSPEQRRAINTEIAKARRGPYYGPFTVGEARRFLRTELKARRQEPKVRQ